ncbi:MAG: aspartate kinase [Proteobacteria bacterium]|jgi:aspartate kinase|nr:aspartate kinase [Desulfocapsa sp.]MBU3946252.1 aspartate kinase [Pseudomonadota bacterium]MCG2742464.1 aspartate kinase [Desulfobacteraceae bacterium]MBU3982182.1 aspartate kinase [Pseudomonadota bacterium]MBU4044407.1 aspartate kinase [Pseudomonadota bacterium]
MALIVQKFGGTSVGSPAKIKAVAERVLRNKKQGNQMVVVLSAMSGETNRLVDLASQMQELPDTREMDMLLSTGEQVTVSLFAMAVKQAGDDAVSFLGDQVKIKTDSVHTKARIESIDSEKIRAELNQGRVVVIAGFQGVNEKGDITTLGRGGSDTTAVALAAALKADSCEIYTDVEGVYTTDPNICAKARKIDRISYDEMLELASLGAKVLDIRSVTLAKRYKVPIHVRSTFTETEGTWVIEEDKQMEGLIVSGVTYNKNEARITVSGVPNQPGIAAKIFTPISDENIIVDMIIQNQDAGRGKADMTFTVIRSDYERTLKLLQELIKKIGAESVQGDTNITKISIVGVGMRNHSGIASTMFSVLAKEGINISMISTSEIKVSCVIEEKYTELAVRALHDAFELDKSNIPAEEQ